MQIAAARKAVTNTTNVLRPQVTKEESILYSPHPITAITLVNTDTAASIGYQRRLVQPLANNDATLFAGLTGVQCADVRTALCDMHAMLMTALHADVVASTKCIMTV